MQNFHDSYPIRIIVKLCDVITYTCKCNTCAQNTSIACTMKKCNERLIELYFGLGLSHAEIFFKILAVVDKLKIRNLTLERSLKRRKKFSDACDVALFIKL